MISRKIRHLSFALLGLGGAAFVTNAALAQGEMTSSASAPAQVQMAANGCGYGYHRTASGRCDNVRDYNATCQRGFHKVPTPTSHSGFRCVENGY